MSIRILPDEIASQIAAGEVVERPASVVKELVENALDAGASHITVEVEGAGKELIVVADDGHGIPPEELILSVARHATSKLSTAADLFRIATLGFRGEALASIGSISRMAITSRLRGAKTGMLMRVDGGKADKPRPQGVPSGTVIRVENLFYNVPARLKFLKSDRTERRHISTLVTHYALAYPQVRFQLRQANRQVFQTSGNGDRREVLATLYGAETARQMIEVLAQYDDLEITGYISPTSVTRSNRREILFFVNGRPVKDIALTTSLVKAYHTMLMVGRYPMATLFLQMPPDAVDVNVHPTKAEVRFRDREEVFRGVGRATRQALLAHTSIPEVEEMSERLKWIDQSFGQAAAQREIDPAWGMSGDAGAESGEWGAGSAPPSELSDTDRTADSGQQPLPDVTVPLLRLVGQVAATYLVAEGPDGLYLIDQHAAHERVLFERFMAQRADAIPAQQLMEPVSVELHLVSADLLEEQIPVLAKLGFQVEPFGRGAFLVRAIPALLSGMDPAAALRVVVEDFEEDEAPLKDEIEAKIIARVCKRAAVKGGQVLSRQEQEALLRDLEASQAPRTCPHGRPTMIHLSVDLLERQFGRRGAR
ncbi:MAG: DNA mismatch repair endonuclease MutL [Anaerolineales bacterium]|nr:DNA mismatch repair endonuclease MutL [Anaerolineales bacterium]